MNVTETHNTLITNTLRVTFIFPLPTLRPYGGACDEYRKTVRPVSEGRATSVGSIELMVDEWNLAMDGHKNQREKFGSLPINRYLCSRKTSYTAEKRQSYASHQDPHRRCRHH